MRAPLLFALPILATSAFAQTDAHSNMSGMSNAGLEMVDDNDPFVPNSFLGSFTMEIRMFNNMGDAPTVANIQYWSNAEKVMLATEMPEAKGQTVKVMTDGKTKKQYILMTDENGNKTAMKSQRKKVVVDAEKAADQKEPQITLSKETRTIAGHVCYKVVATTADGVWTGWVAKDLKTPFADMQRNISQQGEDKMMRTYKNVDGFPLEFEWVGKKEGEKMSGTVKEVTPGTVPDSVFSLDGYQTVEMPTMPVR